MPVPEFGNESEDCLYLDVYVPSKAIKNPNLKLPVVVYIFGGAYILGSKDVYQPSLPFYDGSGMMGQSGNNFIFVTFNYRLGAFGFLAGTTMEKDGLPNAGLWDQRAAFEWVQSYISKLGGDPGQVTAMGESAGGGSVLHHLVANGGTLDPLFRRAIVLSPAFVPIWDRAGKCEDTYARFAELAGCKGKGVECLRSADASRLVKANRDIMNEQRPGTFGIGPTPDGSFIRQLPVLEIKTGNFWRGIESMILSHCEKESTLFVSGGVSTNAQFDDFIGYIFPEYAKTLGVNAAVSSYYPPVSGSRSKYTSQSARVEAFVRDSSMTCNVRYLAEALGDNKVWNMQYSVSPGWHGADLFAVFYNQRFTSNSWSTILGSLVLLPMGILFGGISSAMQSYFSSFIITGDPNKQRAMWNLPPTIGWNHPNSRSEGISNVVNVGNWWYSTITDGEVPKGACDFWKDFSAAVTAGGGYAPPGAVVTQNLVEVGLNVSDAYVGGN